MGSCNCPRIEEADWQNKRHEWPPRAFYRTRHGLLFHWPIGIDGAIRKGMEEIKARGYTCEPPFLMLDDETGLFSAEMLIAIKETPENDPNVVIWKATPVYSRYLHGPFSGIRKQAGELTRYFEGQEKSKPARIYTWVTDCPRCWKERGGPTTVLFARG